MNLAEYYAALTELMKSGGEVSSLQKVFVGMYKAFVEGGRWKLYLDGVVSTVEATAMALILGIVLGVVVAVVRTAHDQQRPGRHNPVLTVLNAICKVYTTVIRGTPMICLLYTSPSPRD